MWLAKDDVEQVVNSTLEQALKKNEQAWGKLSSAQQAAIAGAVAEKKEKLMNLLLNHPNGVITSNDMNTMLSKTMED